jgi:hypothetical protein
MSRKSLVTCAVVELSRSASAELREALEYARAHPGEFN